MTPADARIPCPLCGNSIHPIAGRCKHCKADLNSLRAGRPAAHGALPPLVGAPQRPTPVPVAAVGSMPVAAPRPAAAPFAWPPQDDGAQILPPRPTGRMPATKQRSVWLSWPMLVIAVASLAIVGAVVLMLWPEDKQRDTGSRSGLEPPPAPLRDFTDRDHPLPPSATPGDPTPTPTPGLGGDPWSGRDPQPSRPNALPDIDSIDPPKVPSPDAAMGVLAGITTHYCDRMSSCGNDDDTLQTLCTAAKQSTGTFTPPTCDAARRCFEKIDAMDCNGTMTSFDDILKIQTTYSDCVEATKC